MYVYTNSELPLSLPYPAELEKARLEAEAVKERVNTDNVYSDEYTGGLLRYAGTMYFAQTDVVWNEFTGQDCISTMSIFERAEKEGLELVTLTEKSYNENIGRVSADENTLSAVKSAVNRGLTVIVPEHELKWDDWEGTGEGTGTGGSTEAGGSGSGESAGSGENKGGGTGDVWTSGGLSNDSQYYLQRALKNQGLDKIPNELKEVWIEGDYKYTVRIHSGNPKYTNASSIYRVSGQRVILNGGEGTGLEYLSTDGNWYHNSILTEFYRDGNPNPIFNEEAARNTHIAIDGGGR